MARFEPVETKIQSRAFRLLGSMGWRVGIWGVLVLAAVLLVRGTPLGDLFEEQRLTELLADLRGTAWAPLLLIGLYTVLAPLGLLMSPLIVAGSAFGALPGTIYNTIGLMMGATTSFLVARFAGRGFVVSIAGSRLRRVERFLDRRGFWPLVQTRFLPLPFPVINFGAALMGVRLPLFLSASLVGLFFSTLIHTFFIAEIFEARVADRWTTGATYVAVLLVMNLVVGWPALRRHGRRRGENGRGGSAS